MSTDKGYIKLYRDIRDHWLWDDKPFSKGQAWTDLLMMMNHKDREVMFNGKITTVNRGSRITSLRKLADRWGWSIHKVSDFLYTLEETGMISQKRDSKKTLINVVNYGFYQGQEDTKGTAKEHSGNTQGTLKGHSRKQTRMRNNEEYIRKNEKEYSVPPLVENDDSDEEEGWGYD